jgi:hypothetical protein
MPLYKKILFWEVKKMKINNRTLEVKGIKFFVANFDNKIEQNLVYNLIIGRPESKDNCLAWWVNAINTGYGKYPEKVEHFSTTNGFTTFLLHHGGHIFIGLMNRRNNLLIECGSYYYEDNKLVSDFAPANYQTNLIDLFGNEIYEPQLYCYDYEAYEPNLKYYFLTTQDVRRF